MDDDDLIAAMVGGDDTALRELFSRHAPWLAARLRAVLPAADVEDVLQETFLAAWRGAGGYRLGGAGGWLWGIARRQAALWLRRRGQPEVLLSALGDAPEPRSADPTEAALSRVELADAVDALGPEGSPQRETWRLIEIPSVHTPGFKAWAKRIDSVRTVDGMVPYIVFVSVTLRSNSNVVFQCAFHVVWCPKYRRRVLDGRIEERLKQLIGEVVDEKGAWLVALEVMPDQVHLLVEVDPQYGVHRLVKAIKGRTSRVLREEFPSLRSRLPTLWTNSYFVATSGGAPLAAVDEYVERQRGR